MTSYGATNDNFEYSQIGLSGPGSQYYTSNSYGYGYSFEGENGSVYTHSHYIYNGVTTDYHSYEYQNSTEYYSSKTEYRMFPPGSDAASAGEPAPPYSAAYGYVTSIYASRTLTDTLAGSDVDQTRTSYQHDAYASGYSKTYSDIGTSEFEHGSFVTGSAVNYSVETVTNPYGYSTYAPDTRTY